ncbi:BLOC-2 complex member HPS3 [Neocloeon triangulifer]|uniref:BLOC-2 complex member HPS3 n=1 Tax=Neocloeon triangulifer TaxID=2078957 RepID=UPI00286FA0F6|nr:BLOC-2 complex member HPS3 [Neocloeon triangulifer]
MVRVISVHHFVSQEIQPVDEPLAVASATPDKLLIALPIHAVEVRDLRRGALPTHCFPTVDEVRFLTHCIQGNFVATLESKKSRQGNEAIHARIYVNWDVPSKLEGMRARIAGRVTPSSSQSGVASLEMIELPVKRTPNNLACCQVTGNVIISCHMTLTVFKFNIETHDISKLKFIDFIEHFSLDLNFCPNLICLNEDVISCSSKENLLVIRVVISDPARTDEKKTKSRGKSSENISKKPEVKRERSPVRLSELLAEAPSLKEKLHPDSFPVLVQLPSISEGNKNLSANQLINLTNKGGPFRDATSDLNAKISFISNKDLNAQIVKIMSLQLHTCNQAMKDEFKCLQVLPMYTDPDKKNKEISHHSSFCSNYASELVSLGIAVTTQQEGYIYHVNYRALISGSQEDIISGPTIYSFTAPISCLALERSILHALTDTGLESYTGRAGHYFLRTLGLDNPDEFSASYPSMDDPVCLVGLRPFFSVEHILLTENYLCLLACSDPSSTSSQDSQSGSNWTLYSLKLPSCADLYQDMVQLANIHKGSAPTTYLHLLSEAHAVLGTARQCMNWRLDHVSQGNVVVAVPGWEASPEANRRLERCYQESCALLGDYYINGDDESHWKLAKPFYDMSGMKAEHVLDRFIRMEDTLGEIPMFDEEPKERSYKGLMFYLKGELPRNKKSAEEESINVEFASHLLELFEKHDPASISALILSSVTLRQHCIDRVLQVMKKRLLVKGASSSLSSQESLNTCTGGDPFDALALVLLCLQKGSVDQARTVLSSLVDPMELVKALQEYHGLLFTAVEVKQKEVALAFTELALLIAEILPESLASVLTNLTLNPSLAHQLPCVPTLIGLTRAFLMTPCGFSSPGAPSSNATKVLRDYLESFLSKLPNNYSLAEVAEGTCILTRSYLACLVDKNFFKSFDPTADYEEPFGKRYNYLSSLPPFHVDKSWYASQKVPVPLELEEKRLAYEMLIKLQSLLCSPKLGQHSCFEVLQFLQSHPHVSGALALKTICVSPKETINLLVEHNPNCLLAFAKEKFTNENEWKYFIGSLHKKTEQLHNDSPVQFLYSKIFTDTLNHLVHILSLEEFVRILPGGEMACESPVFKPYVKACENVQSANYLRSLIMETGEALLNTLDFN